MDYHIVKEDGCYILVDENNHKISYGRTLGLNKINGLSFSDSFSFYDGKIDNTDKIYIDNSIGSQRIMMLGNIDDVYKAFRQIISKNHDKEFKDILSSIQEAINFYFGFYVFVGRELDYFPPENEVSTGEVARGKLSDLKELGVAYAIPRSTLAQNLLKMLGYEAGIKFSMVQIRDEDREEDNELYYAYNVIKHDNKYYLFDSATPSLHNGRMSPLICEIDKETYDSIVNPLSNNTIKLVKVNHYDPLKNRFVTIVYNINQKDKVYKI